MKKGEDFFKILLFFSTFLWSNYYSFLLFFGAGEVLGSGGWKKESFSRYYYSFLLFFGAIIILFYFSLSLEQVRFWDLEDEKRRGFFQDGTGERRVLLWSRGHSPVWRGEWDTQKKREFIVGFGVNYRCRKHCVQGRFLRYDYPSSQIIYAYHYLHSVLVEFLAFYLLLMCGCY